MKSILRICLLLFLGSLKAHDSFSTAETLMGRPLAKETTFESLPGLTNKNYLFADETGTRYVLRIPGLGTSKFIDRNIEFVNSKKAFLLNFNPADLVGSHTDGSQITKYVENFTSYSFEDFYRAEVIHQVTTLLKNIHTSQLNFNNHVDLFDRISRLTTFLEESHVEIPSDFYQLAKEIASLQQDLSLPCFLQMPSHGDPVPSNFMLVEGSLMLLDWEYSGLNDPAWDLAFLSSVMDYSSEMEKQLLDSYKDQNPVLLKAKIAFFKPLVEYWLALWGLSQTLSYESKEQDFFRYFSSARAQRGWRSLESIEFAKARSFLKAYVLNSFHEETGQLYLKFYIDSEKPLLANFPRLSEEIGLTPIQFGLWICPYCGILNPVEKQCCNSPNCRVK